LNTLTDSACRRYDFRMTKTLVMGHEVFTLAP